MALTFLGALAGGVGVQLNVAAGQGQHRGRQRAALVGTVAAAAVLAVVALLVLCIPPQPGHDLLERPQSLGGSSRSAGGPSRPSWCPGS